MTDELRDRACALLYPGLPADEAYRRHPQQIDRVVAEMQRLVGQATAAEQRGYDRGRRDFQFAPEGDNHHNAALCPYCSPSPGALRGEAGR
jgi:hypothetical protein